MVTILDNLDFDDVEFDDDRLNDIKVNQKEYLERKTRSLEEFKSMLTGSIGLNPCLEDNFLMRFLRGAKHRPKTALKRLERYYYYRSLHPQIFQNYLPSNTLSAQALHHIKAIPYRAKNLSPVLVINLELTDFQSVPFEELLRLDLLIFETLLQNPVTQLSGLTIIIDFGDFSLSELVKLYTWLPTCYQVFHSYCTLRIKYVHVINAPALLHLLYKNILSSWSEELRRRIIFYPPETDLEELRDQVPLDYLPEEFGGTLSSMNLVDLNAIVNAKEEYFRVQQQYGIIKQ